MPRPRANPSTVYLVKAAETANRAHVDRIVRSHGLTALQYTALGVLARRDGLTSAQLARRSFVTPQSMQDMIRALESKGLIERHPAPHDKRRLEIRIAPRGRDVLAELEPAMAELDEAVVAGFSATEIAQFRALLERAEGNATARFAGRGRAAE